MKVQLRPGRWQAVRQRVLRWSGVPAVEAGLRCFGAAAVGFVLAGFRLNGQWMPLAVAMTAALGLGVGTFGAYAGGCLGYILFFGLDTALEPMAAGLLVVACLCILGEQEIKRYSWFAPGCAAAFIGLVGFLFLLASRFRPSELWWYGLRIAVTGPAVGCFRRWNSGRPRLILLACLCGGLCSWQLWALPVGLAVGCGLAAAGGDLYTAALCGLVLELTWNGGPVTPVLVLASLGAAKGRLLRPVSWLVLAAAGVLLTGASAVLLTAAVLGSGLSLAVPKSIFERTAVSGKDQRLALIAGLFQQLHSCLTLARADQPDPETNAVFDQAAERICRSCGRWKTCWEDQLEETCQALDRAAPAMMTRGKALPTDLPPAFADRCRHLDGFLTAVNQELDDLQCRRQYRSRLRESRTVLAQQYHVLSRALTRRKEPEGEENAFRFRAEVGFRSRSRRRGEESGDRGISFRVENRFILILGDGMGTGSGAHGEAVAAIQVLRTLLQAGVRPREALQLLNGIYLLRDDGGFAAIDLVEISLRTGEGCLYKWGSAPSYLKRLSDVEELGTTAPPPGLGVGETHEPEQIAVSMKHGEVLILVSDGAYGAAAEHRIRQSAGETPKDLAAAIVAQAEREDDSTTAVVRLRPCLSGAYNTR